MLCGLRGVRQWKPALGSEGETNSMLRLNNHSNNNSNNSSTDNKSHSNSSNSANSDTSHNRG